MTASRLLFYLDMKNTLRSAVALGVLLLSFSAFAHVTGPGTTRIEIKMSSNERSTLRTSKKKYEVSSAIADIYEDGQFKQHVEVSLNSRGQSSLKKFPRKNLDIKSLSDVKEIEAASVKSKKLILSASPQDVLVTKNMLVYRLYKAFDIPTMETEYAEVVINGESQGLYMVSKGPAEHLLHEDAEIVYRRRYNDYMELKKSDKKLSDKQVSEYKTHLDGIYKDLKKLKGQALVDSLSAKMNLDGYLKWLALNYIVRNGDFLDEVFFFGKKNAAGKIYYDIFPWDLDDTFADKMHIQGILLSSNNGAQKRSERQMMYGFESRLDQAVSEDPAMLHRYFQILQNVTNKLDEEKLNTIFDQVFLKLNPYLDDKDILKNGEYDAVGRAHTANDVKAGFEAKKDLITKHIQEIKAELEIIKKEDPEQRASRIRFKKIGLFLQSIILKLS